jgi:hypothetical protein
VVALWSPLPAARAEPRGDVVVDLAAGVVRVRASAAADTRLPRVDLARRRALKAATALARTRVAEALRETLAGKHDRETLIEKAVSDLKVVTTDLQSNGGVTLVAEARFAAPPEGQAHGKVKTSARDNRAGPEGASRARPEARVETRSEANAK